MDFAGQKLGRRVAAAKFRQVVEIAVVELGEHRFQGIERAADVADDAVGVERRAAQLGLDHEGGAVQPLRRPETAPARLCAAMK